MRDRFSSVSTDLVSVLRGHTAIWVRTTDPFVVFLGGSEFAQPTLAWFSVLSAKASVWSAGETPFSLIPPAQTHTHSLHCLGVCLALHPFLSLMFLACGKDWCGPFLLFPPLYLLSHFDYAKIWFLWTPWTPDSYEPHDLDQWLLTGFASAHRVTLYMKWQSRIVCAKVNKNVKHWNVLMIIYYYQVNLNTLVFILWSGTDSLHFESSVLLGHIANKKSRQPCKMTTWRVSLPKNVNYFNNYSPSCSEPVRPLFIFRTQIKIFLMKYESFLTLHWQQGNYYIQGPER